MKVLFFGHSSQLNGGGGEICYFESVISLSLQGVEVICVLPDNEGDLFNKIIEQNIEVYAIKNPWWMTYWKISILTPIKTLISLVISVIRILFLVKKVNPDVVITNTMVIPSGAIAAKISKIKHIWYVHEFGVEDHKFNILYGSAVTFKLIDYLSDIVLANSKVIQTHLQTKIHDVPIKILSYAVDIKQLPITSFNRQQKNVSDTPFRILMPSRVNITKRQIDAIDAVSILVKKGYLLHLTILGDNNSKYSQFIKNVIKEHRLENIIDILPFVKNPASYFDETDLVLMCSTSEAFGRITVEAMKMGKCVVGASAGGTLEIIDHNKTGLLFNPEDPLDLSNQIAFAYQNRGLALKIAKSGADWANSKFSINTHGYNFLAYLNDVCYE